MGMGLTVQRIEDVFPLADFICDAIGRTAEVVVHDVMDPETSIVYIRNGELSGRKVGDGATDAALRLLKEGQSGTRPYVAGYMGKSPRGRTFKSSTFFVKNPSDELIGLLCVNIDVTALSRAVDELNSIVGALWDVTDAAGLAATQAVPADGPYELLQGDPEDTIRQMVRSVLSSYPVPPSCFSSASKQEAIASMYDKGVFLMKGAVPVVAKECEMSVATVYRYLERARSDDGLAHAQQ